MPIRFKKRVAKVLSLTLLGTGLLLQSAMGQSRDELKNIVPSSGLNGGLVVQIGSGNRSFIPAVYQKKSFLVQVLDAQARDIIQLRRAIKKSSDYGRISANKYNGKRLPYADKLVNLLVINERNQLSVGEATRVLSPYGVLAFKRGTFQKMPGNMEFLAKQGDWVMGIKKYPSQMDEWRQYLHGADNNAVAQDTVVGPPRHLQWTSSPVWSRSHMAISTIISMVSSHGRIFSIEDHAPPENPFLPGDFYIVARNAFNGITLWKREIPRWESVTRYIKAMAVQLQRRMAAIGDTLYCTPGLSAPITAYDAASGAVKKVYKETRDTQEFAYHKGIIYAVVGDRMNAAGEKTYDTVKIKGKGTDLGGSDPEASFSGTGFDSLYAPEIANTATPVCSIIAIDAASGDELWRENNIKQYTGCSLAIKGSKVVFQTGEGLFCRDSNTGTEVWSVDKSTQSGSGTQPNTVVLSDEMVYMAKNKSLEAYSLKDGSFQWRTGMLKKNYEKSPDIFIAKGALWVGGKGHPTSFDLETGKQLSTIKQQKTKPMGHDRCYRNFITEKYFINSKTGGSDFLDLATKGEFPNYWIRGTCGFGVLPCNGLLYSTPFSCSCSIGAMIQNMNAVYAEPNLTANDQPIEIENENILLKGPAYNYIEADYGATGWPTFRHDNQRSGATPDSVPASGLKQKWEFQLPGDKPSALTIEDGKLFVSDIDRHTIYALDITTGKKRWEYTAGGRVDSPPTFYKGLLLFGSRNGWVYCLKADTGQLSWRFRGLPDKLICAFDQLESAWPINGGILVEDGVAYFSAGRSSFLDGGMFHYGLDPQTGNVKHYRNIYGPFDTDGFPAVKGAGYKEDLFVSDGERLYLRHKAFNLDLSDAASSEDHIIPTAGFLDSTPQHRTHWEFNKQYSKRGNDWGELLVHDGSNSYQIRGFPDNRHSYFDPRRSGYELSQQKHGWKQPIPIGTKTLLLAGENLFVGGFPLEKALDYDRADRVEEAKSYIESYGGQRGSIMRVVSKSSGERLSDYTISKKNSLRWDSMVAAGGKLFFCLNDGRVVCWE